MTDAAMFEQAVETQKEGPVRGDADALNQPGLAQEEQIRPRRDRVAGVWKMPVNVPESVARLKSPADTPKAPGERWVLTTSSALSIRRPAPPVADPWRKATRSRALRCAMSDRRVRPASRLRRTRKEAGSPILPGLTHSAALWPGALICLRTIVGVARDRWLASDW